MFDWRKKVRAPLAPPKVGGILQGLGEDVEAIEWERYDVPSSSNVASAAYRASSSTLRVEFKSGALYEYPNVPSYKWERLLASPSAGSYIAKEIKLSHSPIRLR